MSGPLRLLIVDDNADDRLLAKRVLARHFPDVVVVEVADPRSLAAALAQPEFDAVITDYSLGWSNGIAILEGFKARDGSIPVIMFTNSGTEEVCVEAMKKGLFDYILKKREYYARLPISVQSGIDLATTKRTLAEQERELRQRAEQLAEANRQKDEFLAMLAHELRNPLGPLRNGVSVLRLTQPGEPALQQVTEMMDRQVTHLARLLDDLLDVSRLTHRKVELRRERLDICDLARTIVDDRRNTFSAVGVTLTVDTPGEPVYVQGDPTRLTQVVSNLLDNALKFTPPEGSVRISVGTSERPPEATITVTDTGIGISPELLPHVFDVFSQAERTLDRSRGGLGLGLSLAKGFVDLHGGSLEATSPGVGGGAQFRIRLPLQDQPRALRESATESLQSAGSQQRVLIIEDNRDAAHSLQSLLNVLGYEVQVAYTGDQGLRSALEHRPDAVVCDIGLPGMDGYAVARALRGDARASDIRLIALTGYGEPAHRQRALQAGFDSHLVKPADPRELVAQLEAASRRSLPG